MRLGSGAGPSLAEVGEAALVARLGRLLARPAAHVRLGVGDDAALVGGLGAAAAISTDALVEGVDFRRQWASAGDIGHKAAAVNLSDLAAMGARPRGLLLALVAPPSLAAGELMALARAVDRLGRQHGAPLVGGDLSAGPGPLVVAVTALGAAGPRPLRRHRARAGDLVVVSGRLGAAAAGLRALEAGTACPPAWRRRQLRPQPRPALGQAWARLAGVHAGCDLSDGLGRDVRHLLPPGLGVELEVGRLPLATGLGARLGLPLARALAFGGGEDFELIVSVAPAALGRVVAAARRLGVPARPIGRVLGRPGLSLVGACAATRAALAAVGPGYAHFSA